MDKPKRELPFEDRLRWQILIVKLRIDGDEHEESLQMFSHLEWATFYYEPQRVDLIMDPGLEAWVIALQDTWTSEVLASDNMNGHGLFGD